MKTKQDIISEKYEDDRNLVAYGPSLMDHAVEEAMEEYAQQRVEEATRWIPVKLGKRLEPVKPNNSPFDLLDLSPIEAKTQVFSHEEVKSMLRSMSLSEIRELEKKAHLIIDSHSDKELDEMTEHYFVAMGIKYAQVESHNTQEIHDWDVVIEKFNVDVADKSMYVTATDLFKWLSKRFILTRRNP